MADLENSKWPPQKNLIFQLRQFSIFFHEIPMDRFFGIVELIDAKGIGIAQLLRS